MKLDGVDTAARPARSKMDEGAADWARASNVRVETKLDASAAFGRTALAVRKVPAATPDPVGGRVSSGEEYLMQRQPRWPAKMPARKPGPIYRGEFSAFLRTVQDC